MSQDTFEKFQGLNAGNHVRKGKLEVDKNQHFSNVLGFYDAAFDYIRMLPSFHVGFDYATNLLIEFAIQNGVSPHDSVSLLEIACGHGSTSLRLLNEYGVKHLTAIDLNPLHIDALQNRSKSEKVGNGELIALSGDALTLMSNGLGMFDLIFSEDAFSHMPDKNQILNCAYSSLKEKGVLIFSDLVQTESISLSEYENQCRHWNLWNLETASSYEQMLDEAGFSRVLALSNLGADLVSKHIIIEKENSFTGHDKYEKLLKYDSTLNTGLEASFFARLESYRLLQERKLDYAFFLAWK